MTFLPPIPPPLLWSGFLMMVIIMLLVDIIIFHKKHHEISITEALIWTFIWIGLALLFNIFVFLEFGREAALQYLTGYIIEKSLSVDNLFVILVIFAAFKIEKKYQHEVLFWGIVGALVMRGAMIIIGAALVERFHWILYLFGVFLIYAGIKMLFKDDEEFDPHESWVVRWTHKIVPIWRNHRNGKFWYVKKGVFGITLLFVTLLVIEATDLVFALDSIPAIFAISTNPFIVFTSNIFAILGLRSLYFVIAKTSDLFKYLNIGLAIVLCFIGFKMLVDRWIEIPILLSLEIVLLVLAGTIILSVLSDRRQRREKELRKRRGSKDDGSRERRTPKTNPAEQES